MSSKLYIPPQNIPFRLCGYSSGCALFMLNDTVGQWPVGNGAAENQYFTLVSVGSGRYTVKNTRTNTFLKLSNPAPYVQQANPQYATCVILSDICSTALVP